MPSPTFREFSDRFLAEYAGPPWHAQKHVRKCRDVLRAHLLPDLADIPLNEIEPRHLSAIQRRLLARGLALNTVKGALQSVFGSIWKAARSEGLVSGRPQSELTWPRSNPEPDPFSEDERDQILAWFQRRLPQYSPLVGCVFLAGMRPSEACGLRWGDIDVDTGEVTIRQPLASREATKGKTSKSLRRIRVSDRLVAIFAKERPAWATDADLVVRTRYRQPVNSDQFGRQHFRPCCEDLGLRYRGFYSGRHTFISLALQQGASATELSVFCAVSLQTMQRHYWRWLGAVGDPVEAARKRHVVRAGGRESRGSVAHGAGA